MRNRAGTGHLSRPARKEQIENIVRCDKMHTPVWIEPGTNRNEVLEAVWDRNVNIGSRVCTLRAPYLEPRLERLGRSWAKYSQVMAGSPQPFKTSLGELAIGRGGKKPGNPL